MPVFMIERRFTEELAFGVEDAAHFKEINDDEGIRWLYSFLSADKRKTYCLYEATSAVAIRRAAQRLGIPTDAIIEVTGTLQPDASMAGIP